MVFIKPAKEVIDKSRGYTKLESWKPYTNPFFKCIYWGRLRSLYGYLQNTKYDTILEVGCGYGFFLPSLCQIGRKVIATDIGEIFYLCKKGTLEEIKKDWKNLELMQADVENLSKFTNQKSCDVIVATNVLEHVDRFEQAIHEIRKCLKTGGLFACILPSENMLYKFGRKILGYSGEYHKHYDYNNLRSVLCKHLMEVKRWASPNGIPLFIIGIYARV